MVSYTNEFCTKSSKIFVLPKYAARAKGFTLSSKSVLPKEASQFRFLFNTWRSFKLLKSFDQIKKRI